MKKVETETLEKFENDHSDGVTSIEIMAVLAQIGVRISEATLRKYIQVGLLPRSRRVGTRGRHQGSWGLYPPWTARQILEIKKLLSEGKTIQEFSEGYMAVFSRCMEAAALLKEIEQKLERFGGKENVDALKVNEVREIIARAAKLAEEAAGKTLGQADFVEIAI